MPRTQLVAPLMAPGPYDPNAARFEAKALLEGLWAGGDPWSLDTSPLDQERYARQAALLADRRYGRALELGCGGGSFTERLVPLVDAVVAVDVAEAAVERARQRLAGSGVTLRSLDVMDLDPAEGGPWDLVVLAETIYYLGWLHPMFDVAWLVHALHEATSPGGRLLLSDTISGDDGLMSSWLIRTYHDLAGNVGYELEQRSVLEGSKEGVRFEILIDLFRKAGP